MLPWNEAEPGGEIAAAAERFERRREGFDGQGRDRSDAKDEVRWLCHIETEKLQANRFALDKASIGLEKPR